MKNQQQHPETVIPLTPMQQGMVFNALYEPGRGIDTAHLIFDFYERLNVEMMKQAWQQMVDRHDIFHSAYLPQPDGSRMLVPVASAPVPSVEHDWRDESEQARNAMFVTLRKHDFRQDFDFTNPPFIRLYFLHYGDLHVRLMASIHHTTLDGRGLLIFLNELNHVYNALCAEEPIALPEPSSFYRFAEWMAKQDWEESRAFWQAQLSGIDGRIQLDVEGLGVDHEGDNLLSSKVEMTLSAETTKKLHDLSTTTGIKLTTLAQGAWSLLLHHFSGRDSVVSGTIRACRYSAFEGSDKIVGPLINTLPICAHIDHEQPLLNWLQTLRANWIAMRQHEHTPLYKIMEWSGISTASTLYDSLVLCEKMTFLDAMRSLNSDWEKRNIDDHYRMNYPLSLYVWDAEEILLSLSFDLARYSTAVAKQLVAHVSHILTAIANDPTQRVGDIPSTTPEAESAFHEWNKTARNYDNEVLLANRFEAQVAATPERTAVWFENQSLTYLELNVRANAVAYALREHGIGAGDLVGLAVERSLDMLAGLLGVLKAGAAFVPLDPDYPAERINYMIETANMSVVVTQSTLADRYGARLQYVLVDQVTAYDSAENPSRNTVGTDPSYVIFTSGSTGKPKGVQLQQRSLVNMLQSLNEWPGISAEDKLLAITTISFDIATVEMFWPLINGAQVVIASAIAAKDGFAIAELIKQHNISVMQATPATWRMLIATDWQGHKPLKVMSGGEAMTHDLAQQLLDRSSEVWNLYGPTEATVYATGTQVTQEMVDARHQAITIGTPLANTTCFILNKSGEQVPVGVIGELYIGGVHIADGYLGRPDLTADRFLPDPRYTTANAPTVYRTGDLARYRPDGTIDFLGRADFQVKIRGYRIELGEIEATLARHDGVGAHVVVAHEAAGQEKQLVAYFVSAQETAPTASELRQHLLQSLPSYMVPAHFVLLDALPLTLNGKIDRKALGAPQAVLAQSTEQVLPRNDTDQQLAAIWHDVLGLETDVISVYDDFFALGGHSLLATQAISRIRAAFATDMPLRVLFEQPTIAALAEMLDASAETVAPTIPLVPVATGNVHPLSFAQERLWFLMQLEPDTNVYNLPLVYRINGSFNVAALQHALDRLVQRHASLRSTFAMRDSTPMQIVAEEARAALNVIDCAVNAVDDEISAEITAPFDLSAGPLFRTTLLRSNGQPQALILTMHHIISDGWSLDLLRDELLAVYLDKDATLEATPFQYADYTIWQRKWLEGDRLHQQLAYWSEALHGYDGVLNLPTDYPRPAVQSYKGAIHYSLLPSHVTERLQQLQQSTGTTLFMTLLASFNTLLWRYSGQADIVLGSPIAGRQQRETEQLVGMFVNTLALRSQLNPSSSFLELLQQTRTTTLDAFANQDTPFERLLDQLAIKRDLSRSPLFQVMFSLQGGDQAATVALGETTLEKVNFGHNSSLFDLMLNVQIEGDRLRLMWNYNSDLYEVTTIERMASQFANLLNNILDAPETSLAELDYLTADEHQMMLFDWNQTDHDFQREKSLAQLFSEQVARTPNATAVEYLDRKLTYAELDQRANRLANYLIAQGVQSEDRVALLFERSIEMVVALVAVWKAGAAYVPLSPHHPAERSRQIVAEVEPIVVLSQSSLRDILHRSTPTLQLDTDWSLVEPFATTTPVVDFRPNQLAYVIYTSGSTGKPKGVMVEQRSVLSFKAVMDEIYGQFGQPLRIGVTAPIIFDATVERWLQLLSGHTLVLIPPSLRADAAGLASFIKEKQLHDFDSTPSQLRLLVAEGVLENSSLKMGVVGGEAIVDTLWQTLVSQDAIRFYNAYGPTETTVNATIFPLDQSPGRVTIGKPLANGKLYVVDDALRPVGIGVVGELLIGGPSVARGYWDDAVLSAEKFIPNPFINNPNARVYRSGDLVRWLPNGTLDFIGRADSQIKLNGIRMEIGEIEHALAQHVAVTNQWVGLHKNASGQKQLVAYLASNIQPYPTVDQMRSDLQSLLPSYMIPHVFVWMDALPLTAAGKIDLASLPAPESIPQLHSDSNTQPRSTTEKAVAAIWSDLLAREQLGVHDDFFALGGHSLLATQIMSRIREWFEIEMPLRQLFQNPTIAELSVEIEALVGDVVVQEIPALVPQQRPAHIPLSFAQERLWFLAELQPDNPFYSLPMPFAVNGQLDVTVLNMALNALVARHESLRTRFVPIDGKPHMLIEPFAMAQLRVVDCDEAELDERLSAEMDAPFDLQTAPPFRTTVLQTDGKPRMLVFNAHHIISDGWSSERLLAEVSELYAAISTPRSAALPTLPLQFADYVLWQRSWLDSPSMTNQLAHWHKHLDGYSGMLNLPTDFPRPNVQAFRGATIRHVLSSKLAKQLESMGQSQGATLFMTLLAAYKTLLWRYSGQDDLVVGTPIANRHHAATESLIGLFVNTLPLRSQIDGDATFGALLNDIRSTALDGYANQDAPLEHLLELLDMPRSMSQSPLIQVMFLMQHSAETDAFTLGSQALQPLPAGLDVAKFDLTLATQWEDGDLACYWNYDVALFAPETIERMAAHFATLLMQVADDPTIKLSAIGLLNSAEKHQYLTQWNNTARDHDLKVLLADRFEAQVDATPTRVAATFGEQSLTYAQLNTRANAVAANLQANGASSGHLVGLAVERSLDMLIGLLGILKAGAAFVPIDPDYPSERVEYMIEAAKIDVIVTQSWLEKRYDNRLHFVLVDTLDGLDSAENPTRSTTGSDPAYVIFTSGSTGKPKGVKLPQRALTNLMYSLDEWPRISADDKLLAITTISFDIATVEMFWPLLNGAQVVIASAMQAKDGFAMADLIKQHNISVMQATPATWRMLISADWQGHNPLKVMSGGEAMTHDLAQQLLDRSTEVWNLYGPTEATVYATGVQVTQAMVDARHQSITIGTPVNNTTCYILDRHGEPTPIGVVGELFIGGVQIADGYLGRPDLTAERFIEDNRYTTQREPTIYATGDLARYRSDGSIDFLGRSDFQVKIRGFRIELGEIESTLALHDGVGAHVVVAHEEAGQEKQLAAYFVAAQEPAPTTTELRAHLQQTLPGYMVPAHFVLLDALPMTLNGKIDRKKLPAPQQTLALGTEHVAASTATEIALTAIWAEVLKRTDIGIHDDFFALGGHSLLATQVISRVRKQFETDLPLREIFQYPTIAALSERVNVSDTGLENAPPPIVAQERPETLPLSFAQERLWFLAELEPESTVYNMPYPYLLEGPVSIELLQLALNGLVARHEILRTRFVPIDGVPQMVIKSDAVAQLRVIDCAVHELDVCVSAESNTPFNLRTAPAFRTTVIRVNNQPHTLIFNTHHIISDGWSMNTMMQELCALYAAESDQQDAGLASLDLQFADFALWQRAWMDQPAMQQQITHWQTHLDGYSGMLNLPLDFPRPTIQVHHGDAVTTELPSKLMQQLDALSKQHNATLFMTMLAAYNTLLWRYSGQDDIVVGTPIASRHHAELEPLLGFFANTLALRSQLDQESSFISLLEQVRGTALNAYANQDAPMDKLFETLNVPRSLSHSPLFQVMFIMQNTEAMPPVMLGDTLLKPLGEYSESSKFDLTLTLYWQEETLLCEWRYDSALFKAETVQRMASHYATLLTNIVADPAQSIAALGLLDSTEKERYITEWNNTGRDHDLSQLLADRFESQAAATPDRPAATVGSATLTYSELNARANSVARQLQAQKIGSGDLIGLAADRSLDMLVGLLGILKSGAAFVPIDPDYPADRINYMIEMSAMRVIVTQSHLQGRFDAELSTVLLDDLTMTPSTNNPVRFTNSDDLAYVIFTSGSTGKPKGVQIPQRALSNFMYSLDGMLDISAEDKLLAITTISFDIAILELFWPLLNGAEVVIATAVEAKDGFAIANLLDKHNISLMQATPATWRMLVAADWAGRPSLTALSGGEAISHDLGAQLLKRTGKLWNVYGPTEATIWATSVEITQAMVDARHQPITIGYPFDNTTCFILDAQGEPAPIGVIGELYLGGTQIASGYLNRPDLTAERFVADNLTATVASAQNPNPTLYKTGDLARYRADGSIDFLGRSDFQVKVRGFRIELGEIESMLALHNDVGAHVVNAYDDPDQGKQLVAYFVPSGEMVPTTGELRAHLERSLPSYMIPAHFMPLDALPLTLNGKVDRKALPAPHDNLASSNDYVPPSTETEQKMAEIWCAILGRDRVSIQDDFFAIGGHSLLATQIVSRLRKQFDIELPLREMFHNPTVASLSKRVDDTARSNLIDTPPLIAAQQRPAILPLSLAQERLWFLAQLEPENPVYNMPLPFTVSGELDVGALQTALDSLVTRHEILRTCFTSLDGTPHMVIEEAAAAHLRVVDCTVENVNAVISAEAITPFDLQNAPAFRTLILNVAGKPHTVLFHTHHIIGDGWSNSVLLREFAELYQAILEQRDPELPALALQYADYALWQRDWMQSPAMTQQFMHWHQHLAEYSGMLNLPTDFPRPSVQAHRGTSLVTQLPVGLDSKLEALGKAHGASLFMTLLAAYKTLLWRYSGQDDMVVGTPIANRHHPELEPLLGLFVNTMALRSNLNGEASFSSLLKQVRDTALDAYANQDAPMDKLFDTLDVPRSMSHTPLFQVTFALQNDSEVPTLSLNNAELALYEGSLETSKFDISLTMYWENGLLQCDWNYDVDLFAPETIARMARHFGTLLAEIAAYPEKPIGALGLLDSAEKTQHLTQWNNTDRDYDFSTLAIDCFEARVAACANQTAATFGDQSLTYSELNARANSIAHLLQSHGIGRGDLVGLATERSLDMAAGLVGILKSGAAFVPIDPEYPAERVNYMIEASNMTALVTQSWLTERYDDSLTFVLADQLRSQSSSENPQRNTLGSDPAYVIFTSGSTGKPKGVRVHQDGLTNLMHSLDEWLGVRTDDTWLTVTTISFDISIVELFGPLFYGAHVVIGSSLDAKDGFAIGELIAKHNVSIMHVTPATWRMMMASDWQGHRQLKALSGGEALSHDLAQQLLDRSAEVWNLYGPTEATVYATYARVTQAMVDARHKPIIIGKPIANTTCYILDSYGEPTPIGVAGELFIGGVQVADGYLGRPDLTSERFIEDDRFPTRVYATGDLARYRADGSIDFLGRRDFQVKVRGFRIELGEIEAALGLHPSVGAHIVVALDAPDEETRLVAYFVAATTDAAPTTTELRSHLLESLPNYMVPAHFVLMDALPLTLNGKIDRKALPTPTETLALGTEYVAPRTQLETELAEIWQDVLGQNEVGIFDDFFAVGGHSLLAVSLLAKVRSQLEANVALASFYQDPTVANLAALVDSAEISTPERRIERIERSGQLPLSFAQQRLWFLDQFTPGGSSYNVPFALELHGTPDVNAITQSLNDLIERHEILRTTYHLQGDVPFVRINPTKPLSLPVTQIESDRNLRTYVETSARQPFDLSQQIVKAQLLRRSDQHHVLLINVHHIALDAVSSTIIAQELAALYNGYVSGTPVKLAHQSIQYVDYAAWQRDYLRGDNWQRLSDYWAAQLANAPAELPLPTDKPYPEKATFNGANYELMLDGDLAERLRALCQTESVTMFTLLLAAYQWLLHRYSGEATIPVGTPYASRDREDTANMIGFFVNTLVVATSLDEAETFHDLLHRVRNNVLNGMEHADMPFDKLVMAQNKAKPRSSNRSPIFQTFFSAQSPMLADAIVFEGMKVTGFGLEGTAAKFELMLAINEGTDTLNLLFEYNDQLFSAETIKTIATHYHKLLTAILDNVQTPLHDPLLLLTQTERDRMAAAYEQLSGLPSITDVAIAPLQDAPQGAKLGAWVVGDAPAGLLDGIPLIPMAALPADASGEIDFGRLPQPKPVEPAPVKKKKSRAELLAERKAKLAARRKGLSGNQQEKLAALVQKAATQSTAETIPSRDAGKPTPLSFAQERLWFIDRLTPNSAAYNMGFRLAFPDKLDADRLRKSLTAMAQRHEILRTRFDVADTQPIQIVASLDVFPLRVETVADEAELRQLSAEDAAQPFDLTTAPLLRASLIDHPDKSVLFLTFHHIILDGWSWSIFLNELTVTYGSLQANVSPTLPNISAQYGDFAAWQRQRVAKGEIAKQLDYWKDQLRNAPTVLDLPHDFSRPAKPVAPSANHAVELSGAQFANARALMQSEGVSAYMLLAAVYGLLLRRYSGQDDLLLGSVIANRNSQTERMLGFFANTLPLRFQFEGDPTFRDYLQAVRQMVLDSFANQDVPFEQIVAGVMPERDTTHQPLFQALLVVQNMPSAGSNGDNGAGGVRVEQWGEASGTAKFDLLLAMAETDGGLVIESEYNADIFAAETIEQFVGHYVSLLAKLDLDTPISQLEMMDSAEKAHILSSFNETDADHDWRISLDSEVSRQVAATPDAIALEHGDAQLTYSELEAQANQLAHHLRSQGVNDDDRVGICLPRSFDMVLSVLAVLKAGATYVPLDPAYPADRLAYMLSTAEVKTVLTVDALTATMPAEQPKIVLDQQRAAIADQPTDALNRPHSPERLVYIIYTSGSTGLPKGVMLPQRAIANLLHWQRPDLGKARTLQFASLSFDVHCQEIFSTWWEGGTLVLLDEDVRTDARQLTLLLADKQIERLHLPFVALQQIAEVVEHTPDIKLALRDVASAGEQLQVTRQIRALFARLPGCRLHNHYGPSESHAVTSLTLGDSPEDWPHLPSIGFPLSNTQMYILDAQGQPVPRGVAGDLYIAGVNVGLGYVGRPDLSAEKFLSADQFDFPISSPLIYKTGDRARYKLNGEIDYLGREDFQVKVRGFRIEPGEIEAVLSRHPDVTQAVVTPIKVAQAGQLEETRLVAHVVSCSGGDISAELRSLIAEHLPDYMQPSHFVQRDDIPRTPSGKIDRRTLTNAPLELMQSDFTPPRTPLEVTIAEIWQAVLGISPVSVTAPFFELGGHSLLAVRLMMRLEQRLGRELPVALLFQHNTIAKLAAALSHETFSFELSPLVAIRAQGKKPPLFCIHPGAGQILPYVELARQMEPDRPIYGLQSVGDADNIEAMASSYIAATRKVQPDGPLHLFGWSLGGVVAYEMATQLGEANVAKLIMLDSYAPSENIVPADAAMRLRFFAQDMGVSVNGAAEQGLDAVAEQVRKERQLPSAAPIARLYQTFERNYQALVNYRPRAYAGPVTVLKGKQSPELGWTPFVSDAIEQHVIPGDHFTFLRPPFLETTVQKLEQLLD